MAHSPVEIEKAIRELFGEAFAAQNEAQDVPTLKKDTILLETGLDSLGFAILVTQLEERLRFDPFSLAEDIYYPTTFGEFLAFYIKHQPQ